MACNSEKPSSSAEMDTSIVRQASLAGGGLARSKSLRQPAAGSRTGATPRQQQLDRTVSPRVVSQQPSASSRMPPPPSSYRQTATGHQRTQSLSSPAARVSGVGRSNSVSRSDTDRLSTNARTSSGDQPAAPVTAGRMGSTSTSASTSNPSSRRNSNTIPSTALPTPRSHAPSNAGTSLSKTTHTRNISTNTHRTSSSSTESRTSAGFANGAAPTSSLQHLRHKPAFSTYQQIYAPSSHSTTLRSKESPEPPRRPPDLRLQTHLLHLTLLHSAAAPTLQSYTKSARHALQTQYHDLQTLYKEVLLMRRRAMQNRNLLALSEWCGGDVALISRRLGVLCNVLGECMALTNDGSAGNTAGGGSGAGGSGAVVGMTGGRAEEDGAIGAEVAQEQDQQQEQGRYAMVVEAFSTWIEWVSEVWAERDRTAAAQTLGHSHPHPNPHAHSQTHASISTRNNGDFTGIADDSAMDVQIDLTPVEGLGDGMKAEIRSLHVYINSLSLKLEELALRPIPNLLSPSPAKPHPVGGSPMKHNRSLSSPTKPSSPTKRTDTAKNGAAGEGKSTLAVLLDLAKELLLGMQEELQMMREIEFEVVVGEGAWLRSQVRDLL